MPNTTDRKLAVDIPKDLHQAVMAEANARDQFAKDYVREVLEARPEINDRLASLLRRKQPATKHPKKGER